MVKLCLHIGSCASGGDGEPHGQRGPCGWKVRALFLRELLVFLELECSRHSHLP